MITFLRSLLKPDDRGASAVEYGLLVTGIAVVIIVAVFALGGTLSGLFTSTGKCVGSATAPTTSAC